jgi:hypothetical protein
LPFLSFINTITTISSVPFGFVILSPIPCCPPLLDNNNKEFSLSLSLSLSMTPTYLNPPSSPCPLVEQREDQHLKLFISPHHQASSSPLVPATFFDRNQHDEKGSKFEEPQEHDHEKAS